MKFRIKKYKRGYVVEIQKFKDFIIFKRYYWTHYISVSGIEEMPWHHKTKEFAMMSLLNKIKYNTVDNS